jgi:transposase
MTLDADQVLTLVRAYGAPSRHLGLQSQHATLLEALERGEPLTATHLLDLLTSHLDRLEALADEGGPARPAAEPEGVQEARILEFVQQGLHDPEIAERLALSRWQVRRARKRLALAGHSKPHPPSPAKARVAEAHGRGLTTRQIEEALKDTDTPLSYRSVQQYLSELGLKAHRPPPEPAVPSPARVAAPEPAPAEPAVRNTVHRAARSAPAQAGPAPTTLPRGRTAVVAHPSAKRQAAPQAQPPKLPSGEANELIEAARVVRRLREAGEALKPDQQELVSWAMEFDETALRRCVCGRALVHTTHRGAAQHAAWRILTGKGSKQRIYRCEKGDCLHVGRG